MSYRAGIGPGMARIGLTPREPHIACDGCGLRYPILRGNRMCPPQWFLDRKAPPRWKKTTDGELCPRCKDATTKGPDHE